MANKRTPPKSGKPALKPSKPAARPAPRAPRASVIASMSVLDGSMKPLIRAAFAKRLRG